MSDKKEVKMGTKVKKAKKAGVALALTGGTVALAAVSAYATTRYLVRIALDREEPKAFKEAEGRIAGTFADRDFLDAVNEGSKALAEKEHEIVEITSYDGQKLIGHFFPCEGAKRMIIAMHGWRSSWSRDFGLAYDFWHSNGCSILFAEQRGQNNSGGDYMGFGLIERYDCLEWVNYMSSRFGRSTPIYLSGVSMGASTVLMAAGLELPKNVHGITADCGFTSPYAIWKHVANKNLHIPFGVRGALADMICREKINMGSNEYSTIDAMRNCRVPVLFVHGTDDNFVPVSMTYDNYKACAAPKELIIVPGASHGMSYYLEKDRYESAVKDFWRKYD